MRKKNSLDIVKNLYKSQIALLQEQIIQQQEKCFRIGEDNRCTGCFKRLVGGVFVGYTDGKMAHLYVTITILPFIFIFIV